MITQQYQAYMRMAFEQAEIAQNHDEVPIGAIVVDRTTGNVIGMGHNQTIELSDPSAHAEMQAIRMACHAKQSQRLLNCDLYVTLEPCAMCAAAISYARIIHLYFGATDPKSGGVCQGPKIFEHSTIHHKPKVIAGVMADECGQIITNFFKAKRLKNGQ